MIHRKIIIQVLGLLLLIEGLFMLSAAGISALYGDYDLPAILLSAGITMAAGGIAFFLTRRTPSNINVRDGYFIVTLGWTLFSFFGALPFILSGAIPEFTNAFFETISGFTTTGASILTDVESLPRGLLFWRSMSQWMGGMGIIVLSLAILPILGIGGMQLFVAEVPGFAPDKLHPRIKETAKRLWVIYIMYTLVEAILLKLGGMTIYDAVCHSFTTMATGGYSTKQASIAFYDSPYIHYVITLFMFLAGTNFTLSYFALHFRFGKVFRNEEFRFYIGTIISFTLVITIGLFLTSDRGFELSFRNAAFQVVSIITTTGFTTSDYVTWTPFLFTMIFILMFFGGSAGSTGGGIKIVRLLLLIKNSWLELKRLIHPSAVIPVRYNHHAVSEKIISNVLAFIVLYIFTIGFSMVIIAGLGYDLETSFGAVLATLGNIGPGIGGVGPIETYAHFPTFGKWFLSFLMLAGRLELFTVLVLLSPAFYKK